MRTTLDIADDVLLAAKELAKRRKTTAGQILSELARQALRQSAMPETDAPEDGEFFGFQPFPSRGGIVTNDMVNQLRDEDEG